MNILNKNKPDASDNNGIYIILFFSVVYSVIFNLIDFIRNPVKAGFMATLLLFLLSVVLVFLFYLAASLNRLLFNLITIISVLFSSIALYYVIIYKIRVYLLDTFILILQTNIQEAMGVMSYDLVLFVLVMLVLTVLFLKRYNSKERFKGYKIRIIILLLLSPALFSLTKSRIIMPYAFPYAVKMYSVYTENISRPRTDISKTATSFDYQKNKDLVLIFIIGESARADHFGINGYSKPTSPEIEKAGAVSLPGIDSIYSVTNQSVPMLITRATEKALAPAYTETSFLSIFNKHGFTTAWISYQDMIDGSYSNIAPLSNEAHIKVHIDINPAVKSGFSLERGKMLDEDMLPSLEQALKRDNNPKMIVLHSIGSHWDYNKHYPEDLQKFNPVCTNSNVKRCSHDELANSYDNSILYTDRFIASVIEHVKNMNSIVIYCSDHGEYLGENGNYGHIPGVRSKELTNPAAIVWMSDKYKNKNPDKYSNLLKNKDHKYQTSIFFHSILDAASIKGQIINRKLSIFERQ